jgi:SAM-dependent methyltransferase
MTASRLTHRLRLFGQFFFSVRRRGLGRTLRISLLEFWCEWRFSADTARIIPVDQLDMGDDARRHAVEYFPSSYLIMHEALGHGLVDAREKVFVDYGCGMGRALLFASTLPFKRIVGVEASRELCRAAATNLSRYYAKVGKRTPEWNIVSVDARQFEIPDDASVFYFFNPFDASVLGEVADRIVASVRRAPRPCTAVYAKPVHESVFSERGFTRLPRASDDFVIYTLGLQP